MPLRNVNRALGYLEKDPAYRAMVEASADPEFNDIRRQVELIRARCVATPVTSGTTHEIRALLTSLHADCRGTLGRFRPFVERALIELPG